MISPGLSELELLEFRALEDLTVQVKKGGSSMGFSPNWPNWRKPEENGGLMVIYRGKLWKNHRKMVVEWWFKWDLMRFTLLGNVYIANWKDPPS